MSLTPSFYNFFLPIENGYILYNTFTGAILAADEELKDAMEDPESLPQEIREKLTGAGCITENDELLQYRFLHNRMKYSQSHLGFHIVLTYACNLRCPYCYEGQEKDTKSFDEKTMDRLIEFMKSSLKATGAKGIDVSLYGGEPFIKEDMAIKAMDEMYDYCKENNLTYSTGAITNGTRITDDLIDRFTKYDTRMQITLDGPKDLHDRSRFYPGGRGTYEEIMENLLKLQEKKVKAHLRLTTNKLTAPRMEELLEDLKARGIGLPVDFGITTAWTEGCKSFSENCIRDEELIDILPSLWELAAKRGYSIYVKPSTSYISCGSITEHAYVVDPYLDVYNCWDFIGHKELRSGYIDEENRLRWENNHFAILSREPWSNERCRECKVLPICNGGCTAKAYYSTNDFCSMVCDPTHEIIDKKIKLHLMQSYPDRFRDNRYVWGSEKTEKEKEVVKNA